MSALADQIAEVLRAHVRIRYVDLIPFCECGAEWNINDGHAAHVAEQVAELFTEFETAHFDGSASRQWVWMGAKP